MSPAILSSKFRQFKNNDWNNIFISYIDGLMSASYETPIKNEERSKNDDYYKR